MTPQVLVGRTLAWAVLLGMVSGAVVAAVIVLTESVDGRALSDLGLVVLFYGVPIGIGVGLLLGVPLTVLAHLLRRRTGHWRAVSTAVAVAGAAVLIVLVVGWGSDGAFAGLGVAALAGASAWVGLGQVFRPYAPRPTAGSTGRLSG